MAITPQERELVIIGIAVASGCKSSLRESTTVARQLHVSDGDIDDTISTAMRIRQAATNSMENFVSSDFAETAESKPRPGRDDDQRIEALVSVGAAFAVNCVANLMEQLATAKTVGVPEEDLKAVASLSAYMKVIASSHVERLMNPDSLEDDTDTLAEYGTPFGPEKCAWAPFCRSTKAKYFA
jgi:alkylhydroperoxidase/carboxymuconolactone decarboxylase family protein YurZ